MDSKIIFVALFLFAGLSFAGSWPPYMQYGYHKAYCQYNSMYDDMYADVDDYWGDYRSDMQDIGSDLDTSLGNLDSCSTMSCFVTEYRNFASLMAQATSLYYYAAWDYGDLPSAMEDYLGYQSSLQSCIQEGIKSR